MGVSRHEFSFEEMLARYLNRIISVQRGQLLPHYQTIITLGFSKFAIDSFINEIYFTANTDDSLYSLFKTCPLSD